MATWNSVAQYQLRSYEASTQELSAALRAAQDEARTMKQSLRDAERQQAAEKQKYDRLRHVTSHLYSSLNIANVIDEFDITLNQEDGSHTLPEKY